MSQKIMYTEDRVADTAGETVNASSSSVIKQQTGHSPKIQTQEESTRTWATAAQWLQHKNTIKRLYLKENRTLREVMEVMSTQYDFHATQKMYKARMRSWGCFKYIRAKKPPDTQASDTKLLPSSCIKSPDVFHIPERILASLKDHVNQRMETWDGEKLDIFQGTMDEVIGCLEREVLGQKQSGGNSIEATRDVVLTKTATDFSTSVGRISHLIVKQDVEGAFSALRKVPAEIQMLLKDEPRHLLHAFLFAIVKMNWDGEEARSVNAIMMALLKYTAAFSADPSLGWPPTHPLRHIFEGFARLDTQVELPEVAIRAWKYYIQTRDRSHEEATTGNSSSSSCTAQVRIGSPARRPAEIYPSPYDVASICQRLNLNKDDILHKSEYCNPERARIRKMASGPNFYQNQSYIRYAWHNFGLKSSLENYVRETLHAAQTETDGNGAESSVLLRLSVSEHLCAFWGDEENAKSIHQCLMTLQGHKKKH